jgi:hypothetical protein
MNKANILELAHGAIMEQIDIEVGKIIDNIIDLNTVPKKKRTLTITVDFVPSADRRGIAVVANAKSKLLPNEVIETSLFIGAEGTGELAVIEIPDQIPGQQAIGSGEQPENNIVRMAR